MAAIQLCVTHPTEDKVMDVDFDDQGTPQEVINELLEDGWLETIDDTAYSLAMPVNPEKPNGKQEKLLPDSSFAKQGVPDGAALTVITKSGGAAPRRTGPEQDRLRLDFRSLKNIERRGCIGAVTAYADQAMRQAVVDEGDAGLMRRYTVDLDIPLPVSDRDRNRRRSDWRIVIDLEPDWPKYPSASLKPRVTFLGEPPWHFRVHSTGSLCTKPIGSASYVAGQVVGRMATLINGDEPFDQPHDFGYSEACYRYFRFDAGCPLNPDLVIPEVEPEVFNLDAPLDNASAGAGHVVDRPLRLTPHRRPVLTVRRTS